MGRVPKSTRPRPWRPSLWSKLPAWKWQSPVKLVDEYESTETFLKGHSIHIDDDDEPPISHGTTTTDDDPSTPQQDGKERENGKVTLREYSPVSEGETESEPCEPQHAKDFEHVRVSDPAGDYVIRRYQLQCPVVLPEGHLCKEKKKHQSDYGCSKRMLSLSRTSSMDGSQYTQILDRFTRSIGQTLYPIRARLILQRDLKRVSKAQGLEHRRLPQLQTVFSLLSVDPRCLR